MNERFYLLKTQIIDIKPVIWRHFVVPASITPSRLHDVIQIVMGWTDSHLHQFTLVNKRYIEPTSVLCFGITACAANGRQTTGLSRRDATAKQSAK